MAVAHLSFPFSKWKKYTGSSDEQFVQEVPAEAVLIEAPRVSNHSAGRPVRIRGPPGNVARVLKAILNRVAPDVVEDLKVLRLDQAPSNGRVWVIRDAGGAFVDFTAAHLASAPLPDDHPIIHFKVRVEIPLWLISHLVVLPDQDEATLPQIATSSGGTHTGTNTSAGQIKTVGSGGGVLGGSGGGAAKLAQPARAAAPASDGLGPADMECDEISAALSDLRRSETFEADVQVVLMEIDDDEVTHLPDLMDYVMERNVSRLDGILVHMHLVLDTNVVLRGMSLLTALHAHFSPQRGLQASTDPDTGTGTKPNVIVSCVLPRRVYGELDGLKKRQDHIGALARAAFQQLHDGFRVKDGFWVLQGRAEYLAAATQGLDTEDKRLSTPPPVSTDESITQCAVFLHDKFDKQQAADKQQATEQQSEGQDAQGAPVFRRVAVLTNDLGVAVLLDGDSEDRHINHAGLSDAPTDTQDTEALEAWLKDLALPSQPKLASQQQQRQSHSQSQPIQRRSSQGAAPAAAASPPPRPSLPLDTYDRIDDSYGSSGPPRPHGNDRAAAAQPGMQQLQQALLLHGVPMQGLQGLQRADSKTMVQMPQGVAMQVHGQVPQGLVVQAQGQAPAGAVLSSYNPAAARLAGAAGPAEGSQQQQALQQLQQQLQAMLRVQQQVHSQAAAGGQQPAQQAVLQQLQLQSQQSGGAPVLVRQESAGSQPGASPSAMILGQLSQLQSGVRSGSGGLAPGEEGGYRPGLPPSVVVQQLAGLGAAQQQQQQSQPQQAGIVLQQAGGQPGAPLQLTPQQVQQLQMQMQQLKMRQLQIQQQQQSDAQAAVRSAGGGAAMAMSASQGPAATDGDQPQSQPQPQQPQAVQLMQQLAALQARLPPGTQVITAEQLEAIRQRLAQQQAAAAAGGAASAQPRPQGGLIQQPGGMSLVPNITQLTQPQGLQQAQPLQTRVLTAQHAASHHSPMDTSPHAMPGQGGYFQTTSNGHAVTMVPRGVEGGEVLVGRVAGMQGGLPKGLMQQQLGTQQHSVPRHASLDPNAVIATIGDDYGYADGAAHAPAGRRAESLPGRGPPPPPAGLPGGGGGSAHDAFAAMLADNDDSYGYDGPPPARGQPQGHKAMGGQVPVRGLPPDRLVSHHSGGPGGGVGGGAGNRPQTAAADLTRSLHEMHARMTGGTHVVHKPPR